MTGYDLYFADFKIGDKFETHGITITESQIIDFALQWDPQPFHVNVEAAKNHPLKGLFASGFHTICVTFRLFLASGLLSKCNLASPGFENIRWLIPVRPGDTLRVDTEVLKCTPSQSKPDRGSMLTRHYTINQKGETVMTSECIHIIRKRPGTF